MAVFAEDLDQLYDDQFIETCAHWVIPYIGDLIGYQSVKGIAPAIDNPRSEVAETISLRRRKGTVLVMEQLARDVTAWGAHAVELFQVLGDTQYMNHLRLWNHYAPDLRCWKTGVYIETGFDRTAHKVDVRRIAARRGRYNIQNIGIFLWSLNAYSVTQRPGRDQRADPHCLRFSSLGMDIPLFHRAIPQGEEITDPAQPFNVADRLKRRVLCDDLQKASAPCITERARASSSISTASCSIPTRSKWRILRAPTDRGRTCRPPAGVIAPPSIPNSAASRCLPRPRERRCPRSRFRITTALTPTWAGANMLAPTAFLVEDENFVFPFPDTAADATRRCKARWISRPAS